MKKSLLLVACATLLSVCSVLQCKITGIIGGNIGQTSTTGKTTTTIIGRTPAAQCWFDCNDSREKCNEACFKYQCSNYETGEQGKETYSSYDEALPHCDKYNEHAAKKVDDKGLQCVDKCGQDEKVCKDKCPK